MADLLVVLVVLYLIAAVVEVGLGCHKLSLALDSKRRGYHGLAREEAAEGRQQILLAPVWPLRVYATAREAWRL